MSRSFIYVMACKGAPFVKVGIAQSVSKRLAQIQVGCPFEVTIAHQSGLMKTEIARQVEFKSHEILSDHHSRGEWFSVDIDTAVAAIDAARKIVRNRRGELGHQPRSKMAVNLGVIGGAS